jgi:hypothetical protein
MAWLFFLCQELLKDNRGFLFQVPHDHPPCHACFPEKRSMSRIRPKAIFASVATPTDCRSLQAIAPESSSCCFSATRLPDPGVQLLRT